MIVNENSLAKTIDLLEEALFFKTNLSPEQRKTASTWLAGRQGLKGSYHGMYAPTDSDFRDGVKLFTGEKISSGAGSSHILGELTCRTLIVLGDNDPNVKQSLKKASEAILGRITIQDSEKPEQFGMFCCGVCSVSLWRNVAAGGLDRQVERLQAGLAHLKRHRVGDGTWRRFPYYFTLLALSEIEQKLVFEELLYTEETARRRLKLLQKKTDLYSKRRKELLKRILVRL